MDGARAMGGPDPPPLWEITSGYTHCRSTHLRNTGTDPRKGQLDQVASRESLLRPS